MLVGHVSLEFSSWSSQENLEQEGGCVLCSLMQGAGILQFRAVFGQVCLHRVLEITFNPWDRGRMCLCQLLLLSCQSESPLFSGILHVLRNYLFSALRRQNVMMCMNA